MITTTDAAKTDSAGFHVSNDPLLSDVVGSQTTSAAVRTKVERILQMFDEDHDIVVWSHPDQPLSHDQTLRLTEQHRTSCNDLTYYLPGVSPFTHIPEPLAECWSVHRLRSDSAVSNRVAAANKAGPTPAACRIDQDGGIRSGVYNGSNAEQIDYMVDRVAEFFPMPRLIHLALSNQCNLKCVMCPYHSPQYRDQRQSDFFDRRRAISLDLIENLADQIQETDCKTVQLGQLEEATLHPQIADIVAAFASRGLNVDLTTNGTVLTRERARNLIDAGLRAISFSLDAITAETYQSIRGFDFNRVVSNAEGLLELNRELGNPLKTRVCIIRQTDAEGEIPQFLEHWKRKGIGCVSVYELSEHHDDGESINRARNRVETRDESRYPCGQLWKECFVYPEGEVSTCCRTMILVPQMGIASMGSIREQSLADIWAGNEYSAVREALIRQKWNSVPFCKDCNIWASLDRTEKRVAPDTIHRYNELESFYLFNQ